MKFVKSACASGLLFLATVIGAFATIGADLQMQLGNPSGATANAANHTHYLIQRAQYSLDYNDTTREPNWVSWDLTAADVGSSGRSPDFYQDTTLPAGFTQVLTTDYSGSGYDRGHMCPSADRTLTTADNAFTFFMSNMIPQSPDNNQGVWASFETYCRTLATAGNEVLITSGPGGFAGSAVASGVAIPGFTWKIAVVVPVGSGTALSRINTNTRVVAIKIPNIAGVRNNPWQQYITSAAQLQTDTGFQFFTALSTPVANALLAKVDGLSAAGAPAIAAQPVGQSSPLGGSASFSVTATGDATLTYQWSKDDVEITGATAAVLNISNTQLASAGTYTVVVSNSLGSVTSNGAALIISGLAPGISTPPFSQTVAAGSSAIFTVVASGSPTLSYQWLRGGTALVNGANVSGATSASLTLANVQSADATNYSVVVTNSVSSVTSATVALTVSPAAPTIVTAPGAQTVPLGGTASFTVAATGSAPLSYQWRKAGAPISGNATATTATLTLNAVAAGDAASYDVVVTNSVNSTTSTAATLTLGAVSAGGTVTYAGGTYAQNFDTLPATGTFTLTGVGPVIVALNAAPISATDLTGWTFSKYGGTGTTTAPLFSVNNGASNSGSMFSYGATSATDRALGTLASGSTISRFGVTLVNSTGQTITQFTLGYTGEQWRNGGNTTAQVLPFSYSVGASDINTGTFIDTPVLDFTSPVATATAAALDGNVAANRTVIAPVTITGLTWAPGQTLVLRWTDLNDAGNDHGLAIDDLTFATPVSTVPVTPVVTSTSPAASATNISGNSPITVTFNTPVTITGSWFTIVSAFHGAVAATVTGGPTTFTLTPPVNFPDNDTVTVSVLAAQIVDAGSGTLRPAANTTFSFTTAAPVAPSIVTQPQSLTVDTGGTATFTVVAGGTAPFGYQWRKRGVAITGNATATTATLVLTNVQAVPDADDYSVVVSNGINPAAVSSLAILRVNPPTQGPVTNYSAGPYVQYFDTLPSVGTFTFSGPGPFALSSAAPNGVGASGLTGWTFSKYSGSGSVALFRFDNGASNSGAAYSYGTTGAVDRALGSLGSGTTISRFGVTFVNSSGRVINQALIGYAGEQWRHGGATTPNKLTFSYSVGATDINTGTFTLAPALDFTAPIATTTTAALDGNAPANRMNSITSTLTNLNWAPGQTLVLRWTDVDDAGSDDGLAIDDFVFIAPLEQALFFSANQYPEINHFVTDGPFTLNMAATTGLPVTYTLVSGPATVSGNTVMPTGAAGTVVIRVSQAGNYAYLPVESTLTFTLLTRTKVYVGLFYARAATDVIVDPLPPPVYSIAASIAPDGSGKYSTLLATLPGSGDLINILFIPVGEINVLGLPAGSFVTTTTPVKSSGQLATPITVRGQVGNGMINGSIDELGLTFSLGLQPDTGAAVAYAGVYQARPLNTNSGSLNLIVSAQGAAFASVTMPNYFGAMTGSVNSSGTLALVGPPVAGYPAYLNGSFDGPTATLAAALTLTGQPTVTFAGLNASVPLTDHMVNFSSLARTEPNAGVRTSIIGFTIAGTESKRMIFRAVGPSLLGYGIPNFAVDPQLRVYDSAGHVVVENNDWGGGTDLSGIFTQAGAFPLPLNSKDAAATATLAPGSYTMHVFTTAAAGVAIGEIYDASDSTQDPAQRLLNVSMRGFVETGRGIVYSSDSTLVAGFVVTGNWPKRVLIRASGPALAAYGVTPALRDPMLRVYSGSTIVAQNDNWETGTPQTAGQATAPASYLASSAAQVGAFALAPGSKDAALSIVLAPGAYTVQVTDVTADPGIALIEVYEIPYVAPPR